MPAACEAGCAPESFGVEEPAAPAELVKVAHESEAAKYEAWCARESEKLRASCSPAVSPPEKALSGQTGQTPDWSNTGHADETGHADAARVAEDVDEKAAEPTVEETKLARRRRLLERALSGPAPKWSKDEDETRDDDADDKAPCAVGPATSSSSETGDKDEGGGSAHATRAALDGPSAHEAWSNAKLVKAAHENGTEAEDEKMSSANEARSANETPPAASASPPPPAPSAPLGGGGG